VDNNCNGTLDATEQMECLCDLNNDNTSGVDDLIILLSSFGCYGCNPGDLDNSGFIGASDLLIFMTCFGIPCPE
jgi:hypothetical protein